jgi:hypothetical protein
VVFYFADDIFQSFFNFMIGEAKNGEAMIFQVLLPDCVIFPDFL